MSLKNSHLDEDGFFHVARRRSFGRDVAEAPIGTGIIFGGRRLLAFDPELNSPPKVFNCRTHGHRHVESPQPQVSALCHNCCRRGVTLDDCPRCSARHREHLARIREGERARKQANARDELVMATRDLRIANADDNLNGADKVCSRKDLLREEKAKPAKSSANLRVVSLEMPSGTDSGGRENRRDCRAARPPYAKRARADSNSRNCYFYLGWETPDGNHDNYSSRETLCVEDTYDSREKNTTDGQAGKQPEPQPDPQRKYFAGDNGSSRDENDTTDGDYESCAETAAHENNNTSTRNDGNEKKKQSQWNGGSNWRAESDAQQSDSAALGRNLSVRIEYSGSACEKKTAIQCAAETKGRHDLKNFLVLVRKMSGLSMQTQELVVRHVVAKRERLLEESSICVGDPIQQFLDLVAAIAHLPIGTQNHVLLEVVAERDLTSVVSKILLWKESFIKLFIKYYLIKDYKLVPGLGYYKFHIEALAWNDARAKCFEEAAHLAIVNNKYLCKL